MIGFGRRVCPLAHSVLYLRDLSPEASPKAISGRTSYLQVRLAFHLYPQVIRAVFNRHRCGPPPRDYRGFTLPMGSSPGFGSTAGDWVALFGLAFATASAPRLNLAADSNSPVHSAKGTPPHRPDLRRGMVLRLLVGTRFQVLFHSPPGVLFTVPSRYSCAIGRKQCLALGGGPPGFPQDFSCPVVLGNAVQEACRLSPTGLSPSVAHRSMWIRLDRQVAHFPGGPQALPTAPHNPVVTTPAGYHVTAVWALPCSLAATGGIAIAFSSSGY